MRRDHAALRNLPHIEFLKPKNRVFDLDATATTAVITTAQPDRLVAISPLAGHCLVPSGGGANYCFGGCLGDCDCFNGTHCRSSSYLGISASFCQP